MVHVRFDPASIDWHTFFDLQRGYGLYFEGVPYQRGYGIGSIFRSMYRYLMPLGKEIGRELGREGIVSGARFFDQLAKGENPKEALRRETRQGLANLMSRGSERLIEGKGKKSTNRQCKRKKVSVVRQRVAGRSVLRPLLAADFQPVQQAPIYIKKARDQLDI